MNIWTVLPIYAAVRVVGCYS